MESKLEPPRAPHGKRLLITQIDCIAREEPNRPWIAVPVDDSDLTQGYKDITFGQFAQAVNITARWLQDNLGLPSEGFPAFAYTGPSDYGYALFAAAAAKLGYQMILFGVSIEAAGQHKILMQKGCTVYLYTQQKQSVVQEVQKIHPGLRSMCVPELKELLKDVPSEPIYYQKSWEQGRRDPWLVFHTSGTTGFPKVVTYSQQMLSVADAIMGLDNIGETTLLQYVNSRVYLPMPPMHYVSIFMTLSATVWSKAVPVYGPSGRVPSPSLVKSILQNTQVDGAILVPALIDTLCQDPESLDLLRDLNWIQYAGAPLSTTSGKLLSPQVRVVPAIGSTDAGGYFLSLPNVTEDWDYVSLQPQSGAVMEHRVDDMYEMVFIRDARCCAQAMFETMPGVDRFETNDLWREHPTKKGQWKLVGRSDDLIKLAHGFGMLVTPIELALTEHPLVKSALIGGHGKAKPVLLLELVETAMEQGTTQLGKATLMHDLKSHIDKVNLQCQEMVELDMRLVVLAKPDKPWPRTLKDTPIRSQVMKLYEVEIEDTYNAATLHPCQD